MNIMLQNHTFHPALGGIENYLYHVSKTLKEMGHQPIIFCEKHDPRLSDLETYNGIKIIRHPHFEFPKRTFLKKPKIITDQLKHFLSQHIADINLVISRYPHYCYATNELGLGVPIFYVPPSVFWKQLNRASSNLSIKVKFFNLIWRDILDEIERESIVRSQETIVFSRNNADSLVGYYGFRDFDFHVIPPGVDVNRFNNERNPSLEQNLNIDERKIVILCVGRLPPEKNVERLLRELAMLSRKNVKLVIVGDGPERKRLENARDKYGLGEMVSFMGMRRDVERFYSIGDIFVSPSKYEPFGQVILEAMAAGLPCIAFKRVLPEYEVASEEIIEDGVTGFCVDPFSKDELRDKLLYLIDHPDFRKKMGKMGRKACQTRFTWEGHVTRVLELVNH